MKWILGVAQEHPTDLCALQALLVSDLHANVGIDGKLNIDHD
jgi:hypothetical protein